MPACFGPGGLRSRQSVGPALVWTGSPSCAFWRWAISVRVFRYGGGRSPVLDTTGPRRPTLVHPRKEVSLGVAPPDSWWPPPLGEVIPNDGSGLPPNNILRPNHLW